MDKSITYDEFSKSYFYGLLIKGDLHEAVFYLKNFSLQEKLYKRYIRVFDYNKVPYRMFPEPLLSIWKAYSIYYRDTFWVKMNQKEALQILVSNLKKAVLIDKECTIEEIEVIIEEELKKIQLYFLGTTINGIYSSLIWSETITEKFEVNIFNEIVNININFVDGFYLKSWPNYLSFGKINLLHWETSKNEYFVLKKYYYKFKDKPKFRILLLMDLCERIIDKSSFGSISELDLDYRAKLVVLIHYPTLKVFKDIFSLASKSYVCLKIIEGLSVKIFGVKYEKDYLLWKKHKKEIIKYAKELFDEHYERLKDLSNNFAI